VIVAFTNIVLRGYQDSGCNLTPRASGAVVTCDRWLYVTIVVKLFFVPALASFVQISPLKQTGAAKKPNAHILA
jgi:hypothetical protein